MTPGGVGLLLPEDFGRANRCAEQRLDDALTLHMKDTQNHSSLVSHQWGTRCEIAFARWSHRPWKCRSLSFKSHGDVDGYEIRMSTMNYGLPIHDVGDEKHPDPAGLVVVAVVPDNHRLDCRTYYLWGWWRVGDPDRGPGWVQNPGGRRLARFVPIEVLNHMTTLPEAT